MPSELNRRSVFAAAAAFLVALAVAYALSSTGQASEGTGIPGSPAEQIDASSGVKGQISLGTAQALPALVRKPKPPPPKPDVVVEDEAPAVQTPVDDAPSGPVIVTPPPPPEPPPVEFEDSG